MSFVVGKMKWIMLVSGVLTCTMLFAAIAPEAALASSFGETLAGPVAQIVVRNWGALIALIGGMLIYGAYNPPFRPMILIVAGLSKLTYIGLVFVHGRGYLGPQLGISVAVDAVMVVLFALYLLGRRGRPVAA